MVGTMDGLQTESTNGFIALEGVLRHRGLKTWAFLRFWIFEAMELLIVGAETESEHKFMAMSNYILVDRVAELRRRLKDKTKEIRALCLENEAMQRKVRNLEIRNEYCHEVIAEKTKLKTGVTTL